MICLLQLRETRNILEEVSPEVVAGLRGALRRAGQVCCYGPGREGLVLKAFATRLHQLGIKVIDYPSRTVLSLACFMSCITRTLKTATRQLLPLVL